MGGNGLGRSGLGRSGPGRLGGDGKEGPGQYEMECGNGESWEGMREYGEERDEKEENGLRSNGLGWDGRIGKDGRWRVGW